MKKNILLIAIVLTTLSVNAKTYFYKSSAIAADFLDGNGYRAWEPCEVDISIDIDSGRIVIYSKEIQIMDIEQLHLVEHKDYFVINCVVNDTYSDRCYLKIFMYNNGNIYIKIEYNNIIYKYKIKRYDL